ncbi:DJ-1/PfpI family protein [Marinicella sp. W31]|uniref:DJ-1/PfpI family protein n=1 Tax=Marinicella sp. W31 TaxID=3023713 RepID=UPI003757019C
MNHLTNLIIVLICFHFFAVTVKAEDNPEIKNTHQELMKDNYHSSRHEINTIGILVYDGVNSMDVMGPRYVLGQLMGAETKLVSTEPGNIKTVMGVELVPDTTIDEVEQLDILVIPGGFKGTIEKVYDENLHQWIKKIDKTTVYTTAVCTGGWILGATGLLNNRKATTNWYRAEEMLTKYGAKFSNERYTQDGKYWTAAGVTAGFDMSLAIVQQLRGDDYVQAVMLDMEYDPKPPLSGGTPEKTKPEVYQMMKSMYDMGINPIIEELEKK